MPSRSSAFPLPWRVLVCLLIACLLAGGLLASSAQAQQTRPSGLYIRAKVGANSYAGDRDYNPDNEFGDFFGTDDAENDGLDLDAPSAELEGGQDYSQVNFPSLGFDIGYNQRFGIFNGGLTLGYTGGNYTELLLSNFSDGPEQTRFDDEEYIKVVDERSTQWRHTVSLTGRLGFAGGSFVQPYINLGGHYTFGQVVSPGNTADDDISDFESTLGPKAGIGLDLALTPRIGLFLEGNTWATFEDENIDIHPGYREEDNGFDILGFAGGGLRYSFGSLFTPVEIVSLDCPAELQVGDSSTFTATINEGEATPPVSSRWEFGDGTTATGLVASKTYNSPGTYTVTYNASNDGTSVSESCTVDVEEAPAPAVVASIDCGPQTVEPGESVSFTSTVRGDRPVDCEWDFGDGESSSNCNPTHVFEEAGTYNVTFTASNEFGSDTASCTKRVEGAQLPAICTQVTEFNSAFFERNSSTLSADARDALSENLDVLERCPNLCVDIEGYASRSERSPDDLSEARADAVADYYEDRGIDSGRIDAEGMGVRGQLTKKGGDAQFRRADSIPESCGDDGENSDMDPAVGSEPNDGDMDM